MSAQDKKFLTSKFIPRSSDFLDVIQQRQGKKDFDENFDNEFQEFKLVIKFIDEVQEAIKQGIIPLKELEREDLIPDQQVIKNIDAIMNGKCYYCEIRNDKKTKLMMRVFCYGDPNTDPSQNLHVRRTMINFLRGEFMNKIKLQMMFEPSKFNINVFDMTEQQIVEKSQHVFDTTVDVKSFEAKVNQMMEQIVVIPIPRLRNMVPVGLIDDKENWGIQIREVYPLAYAWEGASYDTIVNDAKFAFFEMSGVIPKFSPDDMYSKTKQTYILHKPVYHALMADLVSFFRKNAVIFDMNVQKINKWMDGEMELEQVMEDVETEDESDDDFKGDLEDEIEIEHPTP